MIRVFSFRPPLPSPPSSLVAAVPPRWSVGPLFKAEEIRMGERNKEGEDNYRRLRVCTQDWRDLRANILEIEKEIMDLEARICVLGLEENMARETSGNARP